MKKTKPDRVPRCWVFFHCTESQQKKCLIPETQDWRCWRVNIACCKISQEAPRPLAVKKTVCKTCAYYKEFYKLA